MTMHWVVSLGFVFVGCLIALCIHQGVFIRPFRRRAGMSVNARLAALEKVARPLHATDLTPEEIGDFLKYEVPRVLQVQAARNDINQLALDVRVVQDKRGPVNEGSVEPGFPKLLCKYGTTPLDDARSHPRYASHSLVEVSFQIRDEWHSGFMHDVCEGGICIFTPHEIYPGQKIRIQIRDFDSKALTGCVKWAKKDPQAARLMRVGIELEEHLSLDD